MLRMLAVVAALSLGACAGPTYVWEKDGATRGEYEKDNANCTNQAYMMNGANRARPAHLYFRDCMVGQGYALAAVR